MATLKSLRDRRKTVQSTRKITLAMKMVAGAKLRRAQEQVEAGRPYATLMVKMLKDLASNSNSLESPQPLLTGLGKTGTYLIVVATSDRGLCGGFNATIVRHVRRQVRLLQSDGKTVNLFCIGRKGRDMLRGEFGSLIIDTITDIGSPHVRFESARDIADRLIGLFYGGDFDVCSIVYNRFQSAMVQVVTENQMIPLAMNVEEETEISHGLEAVYEYEPSEDGILSEILPQNVAVQLYSALLENAASEQGARMTAMDNASRNAEDMIKKLGLTYNRLRQAQITKELIEIISGAEAV